MKKRLLLFFMVVMSGLQAMALSTTNYVSNDYISTWGRLKLVATPASGSNKVQLADQNGKAVQLRGWATHGYQWASVRSFFDQKNDFQGMKNLGANVVRLTCYVSKTADNVGQSEWNATKTWLKQAITWCAELGLYAIVDYHVLTSGNPNDYFNSGNSWEKPTDFFSEISAYVKNNNYKHVLYEICNEPNNGSNNQFDGSWSSIRTYASQVLPKIADNDPDAVVIVGTPQWSQLLSNAEQNKITHSTLQIMYTFHFYACAHAQFLSSQFTENMLKSIPVIVTEWSDTEASGRGSCGTPPTSAVTTFLNRCNGTSQKVSWTAWSWSPVEWENDGERTSSAWKNGTNAGGSNYTVSNLSPTGKMVYDELQKNHVNYETCTTTYTVTFNSNGGSAVSAQYICSGDKAVEPTAPKLTGYKFKGWYSATTGGTKYSFTSAVTGNLTLYAQWELGQGPTMIADCDEDMTNLCTPWWPFADEAGSKATSNAGVDDDGNLKITETGGYKDGYMGVSFTVSKTSGAWGAGIGFTLNSKSTSKVDVPADLTNATSISFYYKSSIAIEVQLKVAGSAYNFVTSIPASTTWKSATLDLSDFAIPSWVSTGEAGNPLSATDYKNVLSLQFQAGTTGTFNVDEIQVNGIDMPSCKEPLCTEYTVTFDSNGGSTVAPITTCEDEIITAPTDPTLQGYKFTGWYNGSTKFNFATTAITADITLTAQWEEIFCTKYTVTFDSNGGSVVGAQTVCTGENAIEPAEPTKAGYTFAGWYNGSTKFNFTTAITAPITLTAQWTEIVLNYTVIADCENANQTCLGSYWYSFNDNDANNKGLSVVTPSTAGVEEFTMTAGGAEGTANYARIDYTLDKGGNTNSPFVGMGFAMDEDKAIYDLSAATGISFWYKGSASRFKVSMGGAGDTETALGWNAYGYNLTASTSWREVTINWTDLAQLPGWGTALPGGFDPSLIVEFQWQVEGKTGDAGWIGVDEVRIEGANLGISCAGGGVDVVTTESTEFAIYPNPAKDGNFNVSLSNSETAVLTIVNMQGQAVYSTVVNNGFASINTNLGTGVYIVSVKSENGLNTQKLVIK